MAVQNMLINTNKGYQPRGFLMQFGQRDFDNDFGLEDISEIEFNFDQDEDMKRQRIFEANINRKKKIIESEFLQKEDLRRVRLLNKVGYENKSQLVQMLDSLCQVNTDKKVLIQKQNQQLQDYQKKTEPVKEKKTVCALANTQNHNASMIISNRRFKSTTIDFYPLQFEQNPLDLEDKNKMLQNQYQRIKQLMFSQECKGDWLQNVKDDLVLDIDRIQQKNNQNEEILQKMTSRVSQIKEIKETITNKLEKSERHITEIQHSFGQVIDNSESIANLKQKTQKTYEKENQISQEDAANLLLNIDKTMQNQHSIDDEIDIIKQKEREIQNQIRNSAEVLNIIKELQELQDLFLNNGIDNYLISGAMGNLQQRDNDEAQMRDLQAASPIFQLIHMQSSNRIDVIQRMDDFYQSKNGPNDLVNELIQKYNLMMTRFESLQSNFSNLNSTQKDYNLEMDRLSENLEDLKLKENENIIVSLPGNDHDLHEIIYNEQDLRPGLSVFRETRWLKERTQEQKKFILMLFLKLYHHIKRKFKLFEACMKNCKLRQNTSIIDKLKQLEDRHNQLKQYNNLNMIKFDWKSMNEESQSKRDSQSRNFFQLMSSSSTFTMPLNGSAMFSPQKAQTVKKNLIEVDLQQRKFQNFMNEKIGDLQEFFGPDVPDEILERWVQLNLSDPIITGFSNRECVNTFLQSLGFKYQSFARFSPEKSGYLIKQGNVSELLKTEQQNIKYNSIFNLSHQLQDLALQNVGSTVKNLLDINNEVFAYISTLSQFALDEIYQLNPRFINQQSLLKFNNVYGSSQNIKDINFKVIQKYEEYWDPQNDDAPVRLNDSLEEEKQKLDFDVNQFIEALKKERSTRLNRQIQEANERERKQKEDEKRRSFQLFKNDYQTYCNQKEEEHFGKNQYFVKSKMEMIRRETSDQRLKELKQLTKSLAEETEKKPQKPQGLIDYDAISKPGQVGSAVLELINNTQLVQQISTLDNARNQSIDVNKVQRFLDYRIFEMSDTADMIKRNQTTVKLHHLSPNQIYEIRRTIRNAERVQNMAKVVPEHERLKKSRSTTSHTYNKMLDSTAISALPTRFETPNTAGKNSRTRIKTSNTQNPLGNQTLLWAASTTTHNTSDLNSSQIRTRQILRPMNISQSSSSIRQRSQIRIISDTNKTEKSFNHLYLKDDFLDNQKSHRTFLVPPVIDYNDVY